MALHGLPIWYGRFHRFRERHSPLFVFSARTFSRPLALIISTFFSPSRTASPCWVISSVFQFWKSVQQNRCRLTVACISYNSTHDWYPPLSFFNVHDFMIFSLKSFHILYFFFISFCMNSIISMICRCNRSFTVSLPAFSCHFISCVIVSCVVVRDQENVRKQNSLFFWKYFHFLSLLPRKNITVLFSHNNT